MGPARGDGTVGMGEGRRRVVVEGIAPCVDGGRFPAKRALGEDVTVEADAFTDGHDEVAALLLWRAEGDLLWHEVPMTRLPNDRWRASFRPGALGRFEYAVEGFIDRFGTWRHDFDKRVAARQDVAVDLLIGAALVGEAAARATGAEADRLAGFATRLADGAAPQDERASLAGEDELFRLARAYPDREHATRSEPLVLRVDHPLALTGAWYELFPRSFAEEPGKHGTLRDVERQLDRVARMGFDVLYLPPIHPIGRTYRKGRNNAVMCEPGEPGSPWAIGAAEGGHDAIHPELGTLEDFRRLCARAKEKGIAVALDLAFQCAPDHPYVAQHPEWFRARPDGTIQYAENPPKKYQDIYPFDFETADWPALWSELHRVVAFWVEQGVRVFRVDNPHTKAFPFWEWLIARIQKDAPDAIFLAEAFTRPKVMYRLAKLGFSQSYNYFPWRNGRHELEKYFTELYHTPVADFFRPNLWPNTPDILTEYLQHGGRPAFIARLVLAATLGSAYGIYGPAFELCESAPREPGSEEYLDSEKYQLRRWDLARQDSLEALVARVNQVRRENPALLQNRTLRFHPTDNDQVLCFSKTDPSTGHAVLVAVNVDPYHKHGALLALDPEDFGLDPVRPFQMHDLLGGSRFIWSGSRHYVELDPWSVPAHIFRIRRYVRSERDFEYFL